MLRPASLVIALASLMAVVPSPDSLTVAAPRKTVAVLYFDNHTGKSEYEPLGKGISAMMISDLSSVQEIQLVERERMQDVVKEMEKQRTPYYDSTTAVKVGRMMGAQYIVVGAFAALQPKMRIDTRVVRVETGEIVKTAQVTGDEQNFFDLSRSSRRISSMASASRCHRKTSNASPRSRSRIASTPSPRYCPSRGPSRCMTAPSISTPRR